MKHIGKRYEDNPTSLRECPEQTVQWRRRRWIIGLFVGVLALMEPPAVSLGGDREKIVSREGEAKEPVMLVPKLNDIDLKKVHIYPLQVSLRKITKTPDNCLSDACISFPYIVKEGGKIEKREVPIKITLTKAKSSASEKPDEKKPTGRAITSDPVTGSSIEIRIEEITMEAYEAFLNNLPAERKEEVQRGLGPHQDSIRFVIENPWDTANCLQMRIVHGGYEKRR